MGNPTQPSSFFSKLVPYHKIIIPSLGTFTTKGISFVYSCLTHGQRPCLRAEVPAFAVMLRAQQLDGGNNK